LALALSACNSNSEKTDSEDPAGVEAPPGAEGRYRIDETYSDAGPYATTYKRVDDFTIFYPSQLEGYHPIITWGNGTMAPTVIYSPFLTHLASWGFVVIASHSVLTLSGEDLIAGIDYLIEQNDTATSEFYGMLDTDRIGTAGHSQGGGGAINAATDARVSCAVPITPAPGGIRRVDGPVLLIAGSDDVIISAALVRSTCYNPATGPTVFAIAEEMGHVGFAAEAGGYITAWFMYHLQGDEYAGDAFTGECEICSNRKWDVEMKNYP
jgi:pimeloyl-ACP methyl ester carboxylesterase